MTSTLAFASLIGAFALAVTAHVAIVWGLAWSTPRWRAPVALFVPPLALYWAVRARMSVRAAAWAIGVVAYVIARSVGTAI